MCTRILMYLCFLILIIGIVTDITVALEVEPKRGASPLLSRYGRAVLSRYGKRSIIQDDGPGIESYNPEASFFMYSNLQNTDLMNINEADSDCLVPNEFLDCANEFLCKDYKYIYCGDPPGNQWCKYLKEVHTAKDFRKYFLALIPLILSIIAILLNLLFSIIATIVLLKYGQSSKKRYAFLLSRSISTVTAQILFYIVLIIWKTGGFEYSSAAIFLLVGCLSFLTLTGTYLALSTLLYIAVVHPFWYRSNVTMVKCVIIIVIVWVISIAFSICVGIYGATLFYPETAPINCEFYSCQQPLAIVLVITLAICYVTVLAVYVLMFSRMRYRNKKNMEKSEITRQPSIERNIKAMNRLSFNLISFAMSKLPLLVVSIVALINLEHLSSLGNGEKSPCKTFMNGKLYFDVELLAAIAAIIWLIGMILDPIINGLSDPNMKKYLRNALNRIKSKLSKTGAGVESARRNKDSFDDDEEDSDYESNDSVTITNVPNGTNNDS